MKRSLVLLVTMAALAGSSHAWFLHPQEDAFWNGTWWSGAGLYKIVDELDDNTGVDRDHRDISALYYRLDYVTDPSNPKAWFRMDLDGDVTGFTQTYSVGLDIDGDQIVPGEFDDEIVPHLVGRGVDAWIDTTDTGDPNEGFSWYDDIGDDGPVNTVDLVDDAALVPPGYFSYQEGNYTVRAGNEGILVWSIPLSLINSEPIVTLHGVAGNVGVETFDFTAPLVVSTVPEPTSMAMAGVLAAMGGLKAWRKRKQGQSEVAQA